MELCAIFNDVLCDRVVVVEWGWPLERSPPLIAVDLRDYRGIWDVWKLIDMLSFFISSKIYARPNHLWHAESLKWKFHPLLSRQHIWTYPSVYPWRQSIAADRENLDSCKNRQQLNHIKPSLSQSIFTLWRLYPWQSQFLYHSGTTYRLATLVAFHPAALHTWVPPAHRLQSCDQLPLYHLGRIKTGEILSVLSIIKGLIQRQIGWGGDQHYYKL